MNFFQRSNTMVQDLAVNIFKKGGHCLNKPSSTSNDKLMEERRKDVKPVETVLTAEGLAISKSYGQQI